MDDQSLVDAIAGWVDGHPEDGLLHEGLDDQLTAAESAAVADHVSRCASCRTRVAEAHGFISTTRKMFKLLNMPIEEEAPLVVDVLPVPVVRAATQAAPQTLVPEVAAPVVRAPRVNESPAIEGTIASPTRPADAPAKRTPRRPFPWARAGQLAAVVLVITLSPSLYHFAQVVLTPLPPAPPSRKPAVQPAVSPPITNSSATETVAGTSDPKTDDAPEQAAVASIAPPASTRLALAPVAANSAAVVAFDSLTVTRVGCASGCDEFQLFITSFGDVRLEQHLRSGGTHTITGAATDPALKKLSASVSRVLFDTRAVPITGRSVCTVFDQAHVVAFRLMVARGASRALHANSCNAPPTELLALGAEIDSVVGVEALRKKLANENDR